MPKPTSDSSRRRKTVPPVQDPSGTELNSGLLDQDAVRRHMMQLMQQNAAKDDEDSGSESESESEEESDVGQEESYQVKQEEGTGDGGLESDEESTPPFKSVKPERSLSPALSKQIPAPTSRITQLNRTSSTPLPLPPASFQALSLSPSLISTLKSIRISSPTEIQRACIPPILQGRDCVGGAKTGSGKTMAFALPILQRIARDPFGIWAVVLTPTRELAYQLSEQFIILGRPLGLTTTTVVGGMDMMKQARELCDKPHVVVATPGRLVDLIRSSSHGQWDLRRVKTIVLDEADRLLTPTFAPDLSFIFSSIPEERQTCLFTATISPEIEALVARPPRQGKQKPFVHRVESETLTVKGLKQEYLFLPAHARDPYLYYLLTHPPKSIKHLRHRQAVDEEREREMGGRPSKKRKQTEEEREEEEALKNIPSTIIFTQRCTTAHLLHLILTELEIPSVPLHSHLTQPQRLDSLAQFRAGTVPVLVTTDVGSRGLDIPEVALVINWDCPRTGPDYVHRVGRTARAGRGGLAVTIVTERDVDLVKGIEDMTKVTLEEMQLPEDDVLEKLNLVSTARRVANLAMQDSGFGERQAINKAKEIKRRKRDAKMARA